MARCAWKAHTKAIEGTGLAVLNHPPVLTGVRHEVSEVGVGARRVT